MQHGAALSPGRQMISVDVKAHGTSCGFCIVQRSGVMVVCTPFTSVLDAEDASLLATAHVARLQ